jgi:hypothetical protein
VLTVVIGLVVVTAVLVLVLVVVVAVVVVIVVVAVVLLLVVLVLVALLVLVVVRVPSAAPCLYGRAKLCCSSRHESGARSQASRESVGYTVILQSQSRLRARSSVRMPEEVTMKISTPSPT